MKIAITGHRPDKFGSDYELTSPLILRIKDNLQAIIDEKKPTEMISGMALGIDTLWAKLAIENNIPLLAAVPFEEQDCKWVKSSRELYRSILANPLTRKVVVCGSGYAAWKMQKRNEYMVDTCDLLIAVFDGTSGGTGNCVKYAKSKLADDDIIIINPKTV